MLGTTIGNYKVTAQLGEGGMGIVYLAEHPAIGRKAAIKVLHPKLAADPEVVSRFFHEARASNAIRHPNIVEAYDYGTRPDGAPYIIMEYLEGESLSARVKRLGRLPLRAALEFGHQAAGALAAAHEKAVVHRDLKPDNLFITADPRVPGAEQIKILDFGIAKLAASVENEISHKTRTGVLLGTPLYMSPEQCLGVKDVDHRTDIYSLGCILHEMLSGAPPFNSEGFGALVNMHINEPPVRVSKHRPDVPAAVDRLILRMLAKKADERFPNMLAVQQAIAPELARAPMPRPSELGLAVSSDAAVREMRSATTLSAAASGRVGTEPGPSSRRLGLRVGVAAAVLLVGGGAAVVALRSHAPAPPPPVAVAPAPPPAVTAPSAPPPAPAAVAAAPVLIDAQLDSTPRGALVTVGGAAIGTTPMTWRTPPSDRPTTLTFALDGYKTEVIAALPSSSLRLAPTLRRLEEKHPHKHRAPAARALLPTDDIKSER
ncbi:MAG TPA: serine/threonine-protein kinase [Polyangia bacterium]|nr:serine/threonine-protein kinase [Polyangia bacterium]